MKFDNYYPTPSCQIPLLFCTRATKHNCKCFANTCENMCWLFARVTLIWSTHYEQQCGPAALAEVAPQLLGNSKTIQTSLIENRAFCVETFHEGSAETMGHHNMTNMILSLPFPQLMPSAMRLSTPFNAAVLGTRSFPGPKWAGCHGIVYSTRIPCTFDDLGRLYIICTQYQSSLILFGIYIAGWHMRVPRIWQPHPSWLKIPSLSPNLQAQACHHRLQLQIWEADVLSSLCRKFNARQQQNDSWGLCEGTVLFNFKEVP